MKHITQGEYELFIAKADAIHRFRQMQGVCRESMSDKNPVAFYCSAKGKITITNPPSRELGHISATKLLGEVTERDGKTYVAYYTRYDRSVHTAKMLSFILLAVLAALTIVLVLADVQTTGFPVVLVVCFVAVVFQLFTMSKEGENSPKDSEILINELKNRVEAVNLWDK